MVMSQTLLSELRQYQTSVAAIITRPPEIVTCVQIVTASRPIYMVFDSHPRPNHPDGAAIIFPGNARGTARYLAKLFPFDENLTSDPTLQWQAALLGSYSGHIFTARSLPNDFMSAMEYAVMRSSVAMLSLKAEFESLKSQNAELVERNRTLQNDVNRLEDIEEAQRRQIFGLQREARSIKLKNPVAASVSSPSSSRLPGSKKTVQELPEIDPPAIRDDIDLSLIASINLQLKYDKEDSILRKQHSELQSWATSTFDCGICLEKFDEDYVAVVEGCNHRFCRDCLRQYISSKLQSHRFPVLCATCTVAPNTEGTRELSF